MPERYLIAADGGHVAVVCRSAGGPACLAAASLASGAIPALLEAVEATLAQAEAEGGSAEVWLGAAWARLLLVDWPDVPLDRAERKALLEHHWSAVLPELAAWQLLVAERGSPRLGVALPTALVDGLGKALSKRRIKARSLLPAVCGALQSVGVRDGDALLDEGDRATLVRCEGGEVRSALTRRFMAGEDSLGWAMGLANHGGVRRLLEPLGDSKPACVAWGGLWA